ncbi:MAG: hypothetical protein ACREIA_00430 [Opitutaceae bacterium]
MAAILSLLIPCARAEMRTFTDTKGRTITAEVVDMTVSTIRIRRDDGRTFEIAKDTLSKEDQEYLAAWELKRAFVFGGVEIRARRVRLDSDRRLSNSRKKKEETWCFKVTVTNESRANLDGIVAEWRVFYINDSPREEKDELELKRKQGSVPLGTLEPGDETEFQTSALELETIQLRPGYFYTDTDRRTIKDAIEGVWIRIVQGREILAEYANPTSLTKTETWQEGKGEE